MTPARLAECLAILRWTQRGLAAALRINERQVRRWMAGLYPVPADFAAWLETLAQFHARHPPPGR